MNAIESITSSVAQPPRDRRRGLVLVNTGDGKGKTSASLGVALRALGWNWRVCIIQFIKGKWTSGEKKFCEAFSELIELHALGDGFTWDTKNPEQDRATTSDIWEFAKEQMKSEKWDLVILDEINVVMKYNYLEVAPVVDYLKSRPDWLHVICTGRGAPAEMLEYADLVSEVHCVKHPYKAGVKAQRGIEF